MLPKLPAIMAAALKQHYEALLPLPVPSQLIEIAARLQPADELERCDMSLLKASIGFTASTSVLTITMMLLSYTG